MDKKAELASANQTQQADLTECQPKAQLLRSELDLCTAILNTVSALVVVFDPEGHIVRCNRACEQTTGYAFDEVRNQPFWELFLTQDEKESVKAIFEKIQIDLMAIAPSHDWITKDGRCRRIAWDYTPFLDSDGTLKYVIGTGIDITQRQQAESELHRLQEELDSRVRERTSQLEKVNLALDTDVTRLREVEERHRIFLETALEGIWRVELEVPVPIHLPVEEQIDLAYRYGYLAECNTPYARMYSYSLPGQIVGQRMGQIMPVESAKNRAHMRAFIESGHRLTDSESHEIDKNGQIRVILNNMVGIIEGGHLLRMWGTQRDITQLKQAQQILQERATQLEETNHLLVARDRLLNAAASCATALLSDDDFDRAVNTALEILGTSAQADRLAVMEHFDDSTGLTLGWIIFRCEWNSLHVASQMDHPQLQRIPYDGIEDCYYTLRTGKHWGGLLETLAEPFRSRQEQLGVKSNYAIPIFVDGQYWGVIGLDYCQTPQILGASEIAVLKTAAACIGSAIQRDRIRRAREEAERAVLLEREKAAQERAAELAKANEALQAEVMERKRASELARGQTEALSRTLNLLATEPELDKFLGYMLTTITELLSPQKLALSSTLWFHDPATNLLTLHTMYYRGEILTGGLMPDGANGVPTTCNVAESVSWSKLVCSRCPFVMDMGTVSHYPGFKGWHPWLSAQGVKALIVVPLLRGCDVIGVLNLYNSERSYYSPEEIELAQVLAGQVSLAVQLTHLAEQSRQTAVLEVQEKAAQKQAAELSEINKVLQAEVADRKRAEQVSRGQTEALVKTLTVLAAEPVLDNFLGYVLQAIAQQLGEPSGGIWLYDEAYDTTILHIDYEDGQIRRGAEISRPGASRQNVLKQWDADYMQLLQEKKVLIQNVQDLPQTPAYAQSRAYNQKRGIKTILVVCLFFGEKFLGNITLRSTKRRDYKPEELELACVLAYQASLAIQLTRLAEQTQQSAVLKERNRIAREIHDTLAQVLTGIVVQLQAAEDVHTTDPSDRQAHIATARQLAKQGLTEARRSVRALRPQALEGNDLTGALANLIKQMGTGTGLQTVCRVQGTPYFLSPDVESNLLRIAQEAFTNILKHAGASEIQIELVYDPGQVRLRVLDNGQGFDPNLTPTESYGLIGMRERTQSIGAELTITSQPREGTEVLVVVPILSPGQRSLL